MTKVRTSSTHPHLHPRVQSLLDDENLDFTFRPLGEKGKYIKEMDSNVMGKFRCGNWKCSKYWSSKCIAINIRLYRNNKYTAVVYHQHCESCNALGKPQLDKSYEERISKWLKIWSGINVPKEPRKSKSKRPHRSSLCEGCKADHCPWGAADAGFGK